jgi:hypothetical protein
VIRRETWRAVEIVSSNAERGELKRPAGLDIHVGIDNGVEP